MSEAVAVRGLSKVYRVRKLTGRWARDLLSFRWAEVHALREVSFSMHPGEAVAYVGPNGAGKSTTIKILAGVLRPTEGDVAVFGRDPFRHRISNAYNIGVVFGQRTQLWWELPVIDSYRMIARIYDVPPSAFRTRIEAATDLLGLEKLLQRPARTLSLGEKMRAELGSVLLHGPRLLLLDEPTLGVDLAGKRRIRQFLAELKKTGVTVFLATHDLADVESTCDRLIMVHQGRIVLDGSVADLVASFGHDISVQFADDRVDARRLREALGRDVMESNGRFVIHGDGLEPSPAVVERLFGLAKVADISITAPNLEFVIGSIYDSLQHDSPQPQSRLKVQRGPASQGGNDACEHTLG